MSAERQSSWAPCSLSAISSISSLWKLYSSYCHLMNSDTIFCQYFSSRNGCCLQNNFSSYSRSRYYRWKWRSWTSTTIHLCSLNVESHMRYLSSRSLAPPSPCPPPPTSTAAATPSTGMTSYHVTGSSSWRHEPRPTEAPTSDWCWENGLTASWKTGTWRTGVLKDLHERTSLETETLEELHLVVTCTICLEILDLRVRETKGSWCWDRDFRNYFFFHKSRETETLERIHLVVTCTWCGEVSDLRVRKTPRQVDSTGIETETLVQTSSGCNTTSRSWTGRQVPGDGVGGGRRRSSQDWLCSCQHHGHGSGGGCGDDDGSGVWW